MPCRPSRFYRIPLLHATLYGLAKHFCSLMGRVKTVKLLEGDEHRLSDDSHAKIARNLKRITLTSSFTGQVKNPFACVPRSDCTFCITLPGQCLGSVFHTGNVSGTCMLSTEKFTRAVTL